MSELITVEQYVAQFDGEIARRLNAIRELVKKLVPEAVESLSYGLIGYKYKGKPLVYIGGFSKHIGFYATPNGHEAFREDFSAYKQGKGSVQFPLNVPLPLELIERVIVYRKEQLSK